MDNSKMWEMLTTISNTTEENTTIALNNTTETITCLNTVKESNIEEQLNKFLKEHDISINEEGYFEAYIVADIDNKDIKVNTIICNEDTFVYSEKEAYKDLKHCKIGSPFTHLSPIEIRKQKSIKEELLTLEDAIFKVLVHKDNVVKIYDEFIVANKYKVIKHIPLNPILKYKIKEVCDVENKFIIILILYNDLTNLSRTIHLDGCDRDPSKLIWSVRQKLREYLQNNEEYTAIINSIREDGEII